jgi:hypothetical protein
VLKKEIEKLRTQLEQKDTSLKSKGVKEDYSSPLRKSPKKINGKENDLMKES